MKKIDTLNNEQLNQLWQKCLNKFGLRQEVYNNPKTLYNLGVYDSYVDNGDGTVTITRQTGYASKEDFVYQDGGYFYAPKGFDNTRTNVVANIEFPYSYSYSFSSSHWYFESGGYCLCVAIADIDTIKIQYKLSTSYTEKVIKNQSLNTLNARGSSWIQDEHEKTLNLFNISSMNPYYYIDTNGGYTYDSNYSYEYASDIYISVNSSQISFTFDTSYLQYSDRFYRVGCYNDSKTHIQRLNGVPTETTITLTLPAGTKYIRLSVNTPNRDSYNFMLVEGSIALPYKEWNGAIVHEKSLYPVGSIYISANETSPASLFGGAWERIQGKFLLANTDGTDQSDLTNLGWSRSGNNYHYWLDKDGNRQNITGVGNSSGEVSHTLKTAEMPSHDHYSHIATYNSGWGGNSGSALNKWLNWYIDNNYQSQMGSFAYDGRANLAHIEHVTIGLTGTSGSSNAHNNIPPYLTVAMWKRVA